MQATQSTVKQPVIIENPELIMGSEWRKWREGIDEASSRKYPLNQIFNNVEDQRAYNLLQELVLLTFLDDQKVFKAPMQLSLF